MSKISRAVEKVRNESKLEMEHSKKLRSLGEEIIRVTAEAGTKYYDLCIYIRKNGVTPKLVTFELGELGFEKTRISEINRVSQAADDVWNEFEARTIGFRKVLALARGAVPKLLGNELDCAENVIVNNAAKLTASQVGQGTVAGNPQEIHKRALESACHRVLKEAEFFNLRSKKVTLGNGWTLDVSKDKKQPVAKTFKQSAAEVITAAQASETAEAAELQAAAE